MGAFSRERPPHGPPASDDEPDESRADRHQAATAEPVGHALVGKARHAAPRRAGPAALTSPDLPPPVRAAGAPRHRRKETTTPHISAHQGFNPRGVADPRHVRQAAA